MEPLVFVIPGTPIAKGRPRFSTAGRFPRAFTPAKTSNYEAWVKMCAVEAMAGQPLIAGPVKLSLNMYFEVPSSWPKWKREAAVTDALRPTGRPDTGNVLKAIEDALNGIVWKDDSQVVEVDCCKAYDAEPHVRVRVQELPQPSSAKEWLRWQQMELAA
jgi:Holliday junction resolvase RusA-like endonuclease